MDIQTIMETLHYDQHSGEFSNNGGAIVGHTDSDGYTIISVSGGSYKAHRLAFLFMMYRWPDGQVDHRDGIRSNNKWSNLRSSTHSQNQQNRKPNKGSVEKGVTWIEKSRKWNVRLTEDERKRSFGRYESLEIACEVSRREQKRIHGEFYYEPVKE